MTMTMTMKLSSQPMSLHNPDDDDDNCDNDMIKKKEDDDDHDEEDDDVSVDEESSRQHSGLHLECWNIHCDKCFFCVFFNFSLVFFYVFDSPTCFHLFVLMRIIFGVLEHLLQQMFLMFSNFYLCLFTATNVFLYFLKFDMCLFTATGVFVMFVFLFVFIYLDKCFVLCFIFKI